MRNFITKDNVVYPPDQVKFFLRYMIDNPIPEDLNNFELKLTKKHENITDVINTPINYPEQKTEGDFETALMPLDDYVMGFIIRYLEMCKKYDKLFFKL